MKMISIIMPYYKKKKYVALSVNSILRQSYKNFEIIIIYDDESKKDLPYIKKISVLDKRIRLIINNKNLGAGQSRNIGIKHSKGKFIAFLDCDDTWHKNKLKLQLAFMIKNDYSFTHTSYKVLDNNNKLLDKRIAKKIIDFNELLKSCDLGLSTVIINKKILTKTDRFPSIITKEDYVLWLKISKRGNLIYGLNALLTEWKKIDDSLSSSSIQKIFDGFKVYYKYLNFNFIKSCFYLFRLSFNYILK